MMGAKYSPMPVAGHVCLIISIASVWNHICFCNEHAFLNGSSQQLAAASNFRSWNYFAYADTECTEYLSLRYTVLFLMPYPHPHPNLVTSWPMESQCLAFQVFRMDRMASISLAPPTPGV